MSSQHGEPHQPTKQQLYRQQHPHDDEQQHNDTRRNNNTNQRRQRHYTQTRIHANITQGADTSNTHWGDEPTRETKGACRIIFQNVNGISTANDFGDAHEIGLAAEDIGTSILGLAETNVDWRTNDTQNNISRIMKRYWTHSKMQFTSSDYRFDTTYQPGGAMMVVGQPWSGRASMRTDNSGMGRWVEATLIGKDSRKLTIVCAYQVIKNDISKCGPLTFFAQQWHLLRLKGNATPDPPATFFTDLGNRISELVQDKQEVILMIDANDSLQKPNSKFTRWVRQYKLVDIHLRLHGTDNEPPTYARGSKRIDYILATQDIADYATTAGILPLHEFCTSDHRALFADFALNEFLKGEPNPLAPSSSRALQSKDPRTVKLYRTLTETYLDDSRIEDRLQTIKDKIEKEGYKATFGTRLDSLDQEIVTHRLEIEMKCARIQSYPWSPKLREAKREVSYWRIWISELKLGRDLSRQRKKLRNAEVTQKPSIQEAFKAMRKAQKALREIINKAKQHRGEYLKERAEMARACNNLTTEQAIHQIMRAEAQREAFARIRRILKRDQKGALNFIQVEQEDGTVTSIYDQAEINAILTERNAMHFSQADGTPFTTTPLTSIFGRTGTNPNCQSLLDGEFDVNTVNTTEAVKTLLRAMKRITPAGSVSAHISADEVRSGYARWRESTTTSPSGLHLSHEKAILKYDNEEPSNGKQKLSDRIFGIKATLLNIALDHTHVYRRWQKVVNALIEKIPGRPLVNKLRVIHLIESDINLMTGILWGRRLMAKGEQMNELGEEQGGARKDRRAQDVLLFKHMVYSVVRLTKTNFASFDNDAKSCYDRIVMIVASLCSQRLGLDPKACELFLRVLEKAKYYVKTQLGISDTFYQTTDDSTMHGPGQGGRASSSIWTIISCLLMKCMPEKSNGATFLDPYREIIVKRISSGFVDDVTHLINSFIASLQDDESLQELAKQTSTTAQWWEELLHATGGKLELQKCFFYMIYWGFNNEGEARMLKTNETQCDVQIRDSESGEVINIARKDCDEAHKTLGAMETPSGNYTEEVKRLIDKAHSFAQKISTAVTNKSEAITIYRSFYLPSMNYSFPVGILSLKDAEKVQGAPTQAIISAMGYNSNMPREVVYGPKESGGIGLRHLFAEQGAIKAITCIQQIRTNRPLGQMLLIHLRWAQLVSGFSKPLLEQTTTRTPHLENEKWLTTLREFLSLSELGIRVPGIKCPMMKRQNDQALMDIAVRCGFSKNDIRRINRCRIFLRAECISDISTAEGNKIQQEAADCSTDAQVKTAEDWPRQPRPGKANRRTWRQFLKHICIEDTTQLRQKLGRWLVPPTRQQWSAFYDPEWQVAATKEANDKWATRNVISKTRRGWILSEPGEPIDIDYDTFIPTDITKRATGTIIMSNPELTTQIRLDTKHHEPTQWSEYITTLPEWERRLLEETNERESDTSLFVELGNETATIFAASDGSQDGELGTYAWVIATATEILWEGTGIVSGSPVTAHRAEAHGKLAWLCFLERYSHYIGVKITCNVRNFCDNLKVIRRSTFDTRWTTRDSIQEDYDVLKQINEQQQKLRRQTNTIQQSEYVTSHQDRQHQSHHNISRAAQLNILADQLAGQRLQRMRQEPYIVRKTVIFPTCTAFLTNAGAIQTSNEAKTLRWKWCDFQIQAYYRRRLQLSSTQLQRLNWEAFRAASGKLTTTEQAFATKLITRWLPTSHNTAKYGGVINTCHKCGNDETVDHLFQCTADHDWRNEFIKRLNTFLHDNNTSPEIQDAIVNGIQKWMDPNNIRINYKRSESIRSCAESQDDIGWNLVLCGLLDENWSAYQAASRRNNPNIQHDEIDKQWSTKLARWLIQEARQKWLTRNAAIHDPDNGNSKSEQETLLQVQNLYKLGNDMSHYDRKLFDLPLQERLKQPMTTLQQWVKNTIPTASKCVRDFKQKLATRQSDIRKFFRTTKRTEQTSQSTTEQLITQSNQTGPE